MPTQFDRHIEHVHVNMKNRARFHRRGPLGSSARLSFTITNDTDPYDGGMSPAPQLTRPLSALPSPKARAVAFVAILVAGLAGALIGSAMVDLQCSGSCDVPVGIGMLVGSLIGAGGMSVVTVLVLRALGEWREIADRDSQNL